MNWPCRTDLTLMILNHFSFYAGTVHEVRLAGRYLLVPRLNKLRVRTYKNHTYGCCCCSHIKSLPKIQPVLTGQANSELEEYLGKKQNKTEFVRIVRPFLMQLDLQSIEKVPFGTSWALPPKMLKRGLPRLRIRRSFLQALSRAVSRFSRASAAGNHRHSFYFFFIQLGQKSDYNPRSDRKRRFFRSDRGFYSYLTQLDRTSAERVFFDPIRDCNRVWLSWIEKVLTVITCNGAPGEAGNSSG